MGHTPAITPHPNLLCRLVLLRVASGWWQYLGLSESSPWSSTNPCREPGSQPCHPWGPCRHLRLPGPGPGSFYTANALGGIFLPLKNHARNNGINSECPGLCFIPNDNTRKVMPNLKSPYFSLVRPQGPLLPIPEPRKQG